MNNECKVIQDLLPNYIENLTSEESNEIIKKHLKECEKCQKIYESMKENEDDKKIEKGKIELLKKIKKKISFLKIILILILLIFVLVIFRRIVIMEIIKNKYNNVVNEKMNNYYMRVEKYDGNTINIAEKYYKDGNYFFERKFGEFDGDISKITSYKNEENQIKLYENGDEKIESNNIVEGNIEPVSEVGDFASNAQYALIIGIDSAKISDKEYYIFRNNNYERYVNKETGLLEKEIDFNNNTITNYYYDFGVVKDSDIKEPNLDGFVEE